MEPFGGFEEAVEFAVEVISRLLPGSDPFVTTVRNGDMRLHRGPSRRAADSGSGYVGVPLVGSGGRQIGSLCILDANFPDADEQTVRRLLDAMGRTIVSELEREGREQSLREAAEVDPLTGMLNRRSFEQLLGREWRRSRAGEGESRLVLADVNGLKRVNDELGHPCGDQLLRDVADAIAEVVRSRDGAGRLGGDEFAVVLVGTDERGEAHFRERLLVALGERRTPGGVPSVAIGGTSLAEAPSAEEAIARADRKMYRDKRRRLRILR